MIMFSACSSNVSDNPDEWFNDMYWGDWASSTSIDENNKVADQKKEDPVGESDKTPADESKDFDQMAPPVKGDLVAIMETTLGTMKLKLFPKETPKTVGNLKWLADKWFYDWIIFHRVINNFMIQWWDPTWTWRWGESIYGKEFEDEPHTNLKNIRWALSMANRWPNTNTSQFFIVQAPATPNLDGYQNWVKTCGQMWTSCHTVFWQLYEWFDVLDNIAKVGTDPMNKPTKDVVIKSLKVITID